MKTILRSDIEKAWADKKASVPFGEIIHFLDFTEEQVNKALERQREKDADIARCCCHHVLGADPCEASDIVEAILAQAEGKK